jgi:hypothetical protein
MFELRALSGQEYVHQYAKRKSDDEAIDAEVTPILTGAPLPASA